MTAETWEIIGRGDLPLITFSSVLEVAVTEEGKVLTTPTEKGGFTAYNKVESPRIIDVTLAKEGEPAELQKTLEILESYKRGAVLVDIVTPVKEYINMTLQNFSYQRRLEDGYGLLTVELRFMEIREIKTRTAKIELADAKAPDCASPVDRGKVETSVLFSGDQKFLGGAISGAFGG